jgi:hypothetical protein
MADPKHDIMYRLRQHFDTDKCLNDPGLVIEVYRDERVEAAREIETLRRRLQEAGPVDPKEGFTPWINKPVAFEALMEKVMELVTVCGGWDEKTENFKPGVKEQLDTIQEGIEEIFKYVPD